MGASDTHILAPETFWQEPGADELLPHLIAKMSQGIVAQDENGRIIKANSAAERVLGLTLAQMQGRTSLDPRWRVVHEDGSLFPGEQHPAMQVRVTGIAVRGIVMGVYNPSENDYRWLRVDSFPQPKFDEKSGADGKEPSYFSSWSVFSDITSEWQAQQAVSRATDALEARMRETVTILESITDTFITVDHRWCFTYVNPEGERLLQSAQDKLSRQSLWDVLSAMVGTSFERELRRAMEHNEAVALEEYYAPLKAWLEVRAYPSPVGLSLYIRDVTERRATMNRLAFDAGALAQVQDVIVAVDTDARITYWSESATLLFGFSVAEAEGRLLSDIYTVEWLRLEDAALAEQTLSETGKWQGEYVCRLPSGTAIPVELSVSRLHDTRTQAIIGTLSVIRDISERKAAEAALLLSKQKQRRFLREMLFSMSEGRLTLCDTADELPAKLPIVEEPVVLLPETLRDLRRIATHAAHGIEMTQERIFDLETAVGEGAMNAVTHAGGGVGQVGVDTERGTVQVWITDNGRGIDTDAIHRATMERGFTTRGTMGHGFWLMLHTCDRIFLLTGTEGTTVVLEQDTHKPVPFWMQQGLMADMPSARDIKK